MSVISMKQLLEAGVHFGHQTRRWNPKMAEYIFTERNGIYIIDLQKTVKKIEEAYAFIREVAENGDMVIFVGTKKQAQDSVKDEAERSGQFYVNSRWLGGMLTNFKTIRKRIDRLNELYEMDKTGVFDVLPKKEVIKLKKEMKELEKNLGGIKEMKREPGAMFVIDPKKERIAVLEAKKLGIPVVAIVDTNCDPDEVDYVIPGNDDAIRAVKLISSKIADAVIEARQGEQTETQESIQIDEKIDKPKEEPVEEAKETVVVSNEPVGQEKGAQGSFVIEEHKISEEKEEPKEKKVEEPEKEEPKEKKVEETEKEEPKEKKVEEPEKEEPEEKSTKKKKAKKEEPDEKSIKKDKDKKEETEEKSTKKRKSKNDEPDENAG